MEEDGKPRTGRFVKGDPRAGRKLGTPNKVTAEVRTAAKDLVEDETYRKKLKKRLHEGLLAPALEALLWHYAYGKPKETHEISGLDGQPLEVTRIERVIVDRKGKRG